MKVIILLTIFCLVALIFLGRKKRENFNGDVTTVAVKDEVPDLPRPMVNFYDQSGNRLNIIGISKPFGSDEDLKKYTDNKDKCIFIGVSSYLEFPNKISNPYEQLDENYKKYKYKELCEAWIHGFRNPEDYFPPGVPHELISESDFMDCHVMKPNPEVEKKYDFVYICLKQDDTKDTCDDWATYNKNWDLAKKCLKVMCEKYKLRGLLLGRKDCELPNLCHELMDTTNFLTYDKMMESYNSAKFIFLPNVADASPRVLAEAMLCNLPIMVNQNILGGWKYVRKETGVFFNNENDIGDAISKMNENLAQGNVYNPRKYFLENYGIINSGRRLKEFLYKNFGNRINLPKHQVEFVTIDYPKVQYSHCTN